MRLVGNVARRRFFVPEVVQTSAMDCGPATLKSLLAGFGVPVSYGRLREACQTDVDGTSIDTIEELAIELGLNAEQVITPVDHLRYADADNLPAIVVAQQPGGAMHFAVVWRRHGGTFQLMDPATGRRWASWDRLLDEVFIHEMIVPAAAWRKWAQTEEFLGPLRRRLAELGIASSRVSRLIESALDAGGWRPLATLDAAARLVSSMVRAKGVRAGRDAAGILSAIYELVGESSDGAGSIPHDCWIVREAPSDGDEENVFVRGAVLVRARGRRVAKEADESRLKDAAPTERATCREVEAAAREAPTRPLRDLFRFVKTDGWITMLVLLAGLLIAAAGVLAEAVLFRGLLDLSRSLGLGVQRLGIMAAVVAFAVALMLLELPVFAGLLRLGRRLESRFRMAFLEKLPRLNDHYLRSRPTSDMAERCHMLHALRNLPGLGALFFRSCFAILLTTLGIIWLDPQCLVPAVITAVASVVLPLLVQPLLAERDLRVRTHAGALSRFYLDAMIGLTPIRSHGAEPTVKREHESLLTEWARSGLGLQRMAVAADAALSLVGYVLAAWVLWTHLANQGGQANILLLAYWALHLPILGQAIAAIARQYPSSRNITLRLMEPLGALEDEQSDKEASATQHEGRVTGDVTEESDTVTRKTAAPPVPAMSRAESRQHGVAIRFENVRVRAAGHTILKEIELAIEPGTHVAIVGASGAGKSTLVGVLLGWRRPCAGEVRVDGELLEADVIRRLRRRTAWVDPAVQLWNRSLLANLRYGVARDRVLPMREMLAGADLRPLLETLPDGLQTSLGEGGAFLSGGEGQRVRLGRALARNEADLVILDEPFRGLDRPRRRKLLEEARRWWRRATLLCVTHDMDATRDFDQVVVVDGERVVETGRPADLLARNDSRYRLSTDAEAALREGKWSGVGWRRMTLLNGALREDGHAESP